MKDPGSERFEQLAAMGLVASLLIGLWLLAGWAAPTAGGAIALAADQVGASRQTVEGHSFLIENVGQFDPSGRFLLRHGLGQTWLTAEPAIWLSVLDQEAMAEMEPMERGDRGADREIPAVNLRFSFVGANPKPAIETSEARATQVSYLLGREAEGWFRQVPVWGEVRYRDLYPGVDLVFSADAAGAAQATLPWRLEAEAGADLEAVRLRVDGAATVGVVDGRMTLDTGAGRLSLPLLAVVGLEDGQTGLAAASRPPEVAPLSGQGFLISAPFASTETLADESAAGLEYGTYLGGSSWDWAYGVEIDAVGAAYVVGVTPSPNFPTVPGSYRTTLDAQDAFVVKVASDGSTLEYATFLGGSASDSGYGLTVVEGEAYVTGETWSPDFPTTGGAYDRSCGSSGDCDGWTDVFLVRLNAKGSDLLYATYLGGKDEEYGNAVEVSSGEAHVVGSTWSQDFPTTPGAYDRTCGVDGRCDPYQGVPTADAFLAKLSPDGNGAVDLLYATFLGGSEADGASDVAVSGGDAFLTGDSASPDFPADGYAGGDDAFVVRLNPGGGGQADRVYGTFLGGTSTDRGHGIAVSGSSAAATGETRSSDFPVTTGGYHGGFNDAFVATLDGEGNVKYAAFLGGSDRDHGRAIALEGTGAMVVAGYTQSPSDTFPVTAGAYDPIENGGRDAFVARVFLESSRPEHITYASYLGGSLDEEAYGVAVDEAGSAYLIGYTRSVTDFPTTVGAFGPNYNGGTRDAFVSKLKVGGAPGLNVEKSVNGLDADEPPGPYLTVGAPVTWTYVVVNAGGLDVSDVLVVDDLLGTICQEAVLPSGGSFTCSRQGMAEPGQYVNAATVTGQPDGGGDPVSDIDLSHYFGVEAGIALAKLTNGQQADAPPGSMILTGDPVTWTYVVTNSGNVRLRDIVLTDRVEGQAACEASTLAGNQSMTCVLTGTASSGPYSNTATVMGIPPGGLAPVSDEDDGYYFGADPAPAIELTKLTNGVEAGAPPGPSIPIDDPVTWTYVVENTGNVPLTGITVVDDNGTAGEPNDDVEACTFSSLAPAVVQECTLEGLAIEGPYVNLATVTASYEGLPVMDVALGHYRGGVYQVYLPVVVRQWP